MHRRQYLTSAATAATATLAGCAGVLSGGGYSAAQDPWSNSTSQEVQNGRLDSGTVQLPANTYAPSSYTHQFPVNITVSARATKPMDVYALADTEYQRYRDGEEFTISQLAAEGTRTPRFSGGLSAGTTHVVFDNTSVATPPDGSVRAKYRIKRTR